MSIAIHLLLASSVILGLLLARRVYFVRKENFLYRVTACGAFCTSVLAFTEYEIAGQTAIENVLTIGIAHTILTSFIIFISVISIWTFAEPFSSKKYPYLNRILFTLNFICLLTIWISELSGNRFITGVSYESLTWQYELRSEGFMVILFQLWYGTQLIAPIIALYFFYKKSDILKVKQWGRYILAIVVAVFIAIFVLFAFNGSQTLKGYYCISPFLLICVAFFSFIYTNFELFTVSPMNAFNDILEQMSNMVAITDTNFNITYVNKATLNELQLEKQVLPKISFHDIAKRFKATQWEEDISKITVLEKGKKYIKQFKLKHQEESLYYHIIFSPVFNKKNIKTGYLGIATNITQSKKSEQKLQEYNAELQQSNTELQRFAYIASHDLKTPLRSVTSFLNLIQRHISKKYNDPEIESFIEYAVNGAKQMHHLIQDVLEFSTIKKEVNFTEEEVDLNEIITTVCQTLKAAIEEKNALIFAEPLPTIISEHSRMLQLFQNLIDNGIKYNDSDQPTIYISYQDKENHHRIIIRDNGIGIEEAYKDQVFHMFRRLHRPAEYEGTGIGLAICKKIVTLYKGNIELHSVFGQGSQFIITLPKSVIESPVNSKLQFRQDAPPAIVD